MEGHAGHSAVAQHVLPALREGIPCNVVSVGALSEPGLLEQLALAAQSGETAVQLVAGALGAIDPLTAVRIGSRAAARCEGR